MKLSKLLKESFTMPSADQVVFMQKIATSTDWGFLGKCGSEKKVPRYVSVDPHSGAFGYDGDNPFDRLYDLFWDGRKAGHDCVKDFNAFIKPIDKDYDWMKAFVKKPENKEFLTDASVGTPTIKTFETLAKGYEYIKANAIKNAKSIKKFADSAKQVVGKPTEQAVKFITKFTKDAQIVDLLTGQTQPAYEQRWTKEENIYTEIKRFDGMAKITGQCDAYFYFNDGKCTGYQL